MAERYVFPVRFDEAVMRRAVTGFVTRALFFDAPLKTFAPLALIAVSCVALYASGEEEIAVELSIAIVAILSIFVFSGWRMHWRIMREKIEAMHGRFAVARLRDDGLVIEGPGPAALLEWPAIKRIWQLDGVWLLILSTNHFVALPLASAPREALDYLATQAGRAGAVG